MSGSTGSGQMNFTLSPLAPFRLDLTALALRRDPANAVDRWDSPAFRRVFVLDGAPIDATVQQTGPLNKPSLTVKSLGPTAGQGMQQRLASLLRLVLGLDVDLTRFYELAELDEGLAPLARHFAGLKPPVMPAVFEALVSGIACQQLSLAAGVHLLARLARTYGLSLSGRYAFPRPRDLLGASPQDLRSLGFSLRKAKVILQLAQEEASGDLHLEGLRALDTPAVLQTLVALQGIGRWTAEYVALRGLGRLDVFPADDVGAQNKLQRLLGLAARPSADETARIVERWRPYRGLLYFHLLLNSLDTGQALPQGVEETS